jgi:mono/diheme cytochrome c family protein
MVAEGAQLFSGGTCPLCHGPGGANGPYGPDLTDQIYLQNDGSWTGITSTITTGVPATQFRSPTSRPEFFMQPRGGMPISDAQVRSVAAYVWALSHH